MERNLGRRAASEGFVEEKLLPLLEELVRDDTIGSPLRAAALIAAARQSDSVDGRRTPRDERLETLIREGLTSPSSNVREASVLSLGLLGSAGASITLAEIALDTEKGRALVKDDRVPIRSRAMATYGLGLATHNAESSAQWAYAVQQLRAILADKSADQVDVRTAAVLAMGLIPAETLSGDGGSDSRGLNALANDLLEQLDDKRADRFVRNRIPTVLGRLAAGLDEETRANALDTLIDSLSERSKLPTPARRAAALALGQIEDLEDAKQGKRRREGLTRALKSKDAMVRRYAALSLARIGSRGSLDDKDAEKVADTLVRHLTRGRSADEPWTTLALGVFAHRRNAAGASDFEVSKTLEKTLSKSRSTDRAPAHALAAGLAGSDMAVAAMQSRFEHSSGDATRGWLGLAMGLAGETEALEYLRDAAVEAHQHPDLRAELALARAMLSDKDLIPELLEQLDECDCYNSTRGSARALARVGDSRALGALLKLARDTQRGERARAEAVMALGWIASGDDSPRSTPLVVALDLVEPPDTLTEPTGFGVLDRL